MQTEMFKFASQRRESPLISVPIFRSFLGDQRLCITSSTSLQMSPVCFILCKQASLIEDNLSGQWAIRFLQYIAVQGLRGLLNCVQFAKNV